MYRFIIPEIMRTFADRVLYLDGDVVCNGDITKFIDMDLNGGDSYSSSRGPLW